MNLLNVGISRISAVMLLCAILCLAQLVQAQPVAGAPPFDHSKTGFLLRDVHYTLKCEQCHVDGIFKNTPKVCSGCHATGTRVAATPKPINHVPTTNECDTCHVSAATFLVKSYDHVGVTGGCSICHNGQSLGVVSKLANHFPTTQPCENCHKNTSTFLSWTMDHTGLTGGCSSCHLGQFAGVVGLPPVPTAHVPLQAGQECDSCHTSFTTFLGAVFNHDGITGTCASCHSGQIKGVVSLPPVPANHITIPGGQDCNACHLSTVSFLGAVYSHTGVTPGSCNTCHTGAYPGVLTKPAYHIPTGSATCDVCHTAINTVGYTSFKGAQYHATVTATAGSCASCHNGAYTSTSGNGLIPQSVVNASGGHIPVAGSSCDLCHTASNTSFYTTFQGSTYHLSQNATAGSCTTCHSGTITTVSVSGVPPYGKAAAVTLSGIAHAVTSASCDTCHTQANTANYTTFLGATFDHSTASPPVAGRCSTCHDGVQAKGKAATHIVTALQCDSAGCHTATTTVNYTTFLNGTVHPLTAVATGSCANASCHDGSPAGLAANAQPKPTPHPSTSVTQCDSTGGCHIPSSTASFSTWTGAMFHPAGTGTAGACLSAGCHDGTGIGYGAQFTTSSPTPHVATSGAQCDTCHVSTLNFTTWLGATYNHASVAAGSCLNCHDGVQASGQLLPHIPATGSCDAAGCHTTALANVPLGYPAAWAGATYAPHPGSAAGTCRTCHTGTYPGVSTTSFNPGGLGGLNGQAHAVTSAQCDTCHTSAISGYLTSAPTWAGAGYAHSAADAGQCAKSGCHSAGGSGKGVSAGHIPVSISCDSGGCHKVFGGAVTSFAGGIWYHSLFSARCDSCHVTGKYPGFGTYTALGTAAVNHIPLGMSGTNDCNYCHTSVVPTGAATSGTSAWSAATVGVTQHNNDQGGSPNYCVTCHLSSSTYLASGITKMNHKSASTAKDCSSSSCHKPLGGTGTSWSKWK
jgi:hypothetical protein